MTDERRELVLRQADVTMRGVAGGLVEVGVRAGARVLVGMQNSGETFWYMPLCASSGQSPCRSCLA